MRWINSVSARNKMNSIHPPYKYSLKKTLNCGFRDIDKLFIIILNRLTSLIISTTVVLGAITLITCFTGRTTIVEWEIISLGPTAISAPVIIDPCGIVFITTVSLITSSVLQFSKFYMAHEKFINRFIILVIIFVISIAFIILFPHAVTLLIGWDGLGITSFILVIYYQTPKSLGAGLLTALTNRVGDVILLLSIAYITRQGHWLIINLWQDSIHCWIVFIITLAAITKSAQIPFSRWLPAAIAAPTPVSALVHSSTLVTAGVFLLIRFYPLISTWNIFFNILMIASTLTMLIAGARAIAECDIKKIIALSTLSQLGVIIFTISINMPIVAFFHLITHALFKALLFICAGYIINIHHHSQDLRTMGNVTPQTPIIIRSILVSNIALCGAPFIAGFYSKDLIIELYSSSLQQSIITTIFTMATILTTAYSTRFMLYVALSINHRPSSQYSSESISEYCAASALTVGAIIGGAAINWLLIDPIIIPPIITREKVKPLVIILTGLATGLMVYKSEKKGSSLTTVINSSMWFLTPNVTHSPQPLILSPCFWQLKITDQGWNESPQLLFANNLFSSSSTINIQINLITTQVISIALLIIAIVNFKFLGIVVLQ